MVQFIAGGKGEGKTKKLIDMANSSAKTTDGRLVFIDDDRRHIFDLHVDIRFVEVSRSMLSNYRELIGFIYGILSLDSDIKQIYVDGLSNIVRTIENEDLVKLVAKIEKLSEEHSVDFILSSNCKVEGLPEEIKKILI